MTPLHVAAERGGRFKILKYLADNEADVNIQDDDGVSVWDYIAVSLLVLRIWLALFPGTWENEVFDHLVVLTQKVEYCKLPIFKCFVASVFY